MTLKTLLVLSAALHLCFTARLPRQASSIKEKVKNLSKLDECGLSSFHLTPKIIGESPVDVGVIRPICLPPSEFNKSNFEGYFPTVVGWARTAVGTSKEEKRLFKDEVEIQNTEACKRNVTSAPGLSAAVIDDRVVCAATPADIRHWRKSIPVDSGGPLMMPRKLKKSSKTNFFLMGIVSYGDGGAKDGYPGVYTRVSRFLPWVLENLDI